MTTAPDTNTTSPAFEDAMGFHRTELRVALTTMDEEAFLHHTARLLAWNDTEIDRLTTALDEAVRHQPQPD